VPTEDQTFALEGETVKRLASAVPVVMPVGGVKATPVPHPPAVSASEPEKRGERKHERKRRKKHR
jgi:hypothetical protein